MSAATQLLSKQDLMDILKASDDNNKRNGITGILIFKDGDFMQLLEGDRDAVLKTMERIEADSRHSHLIIVYDQPATERLFPNWSMAFRDLSNMAGVEGYSNIMNPDGSLMDLVDSPDGAMGIVKWFAGKPGIPT